VRSYLEDNERLKEEEKRRQEHEDEEILRFKPRHDNPRRCPKPET
jgi:hypothetical protein